MFLKITNAGICHPQAFTLLGVSTARGDTNKIGQFGSGAKMGILTCLRHAINPVIVSGNSVITFDCVTKHMGDKQYDQVVAIIDGQRQELGFALEFGAIDWTKIDYAVREFVSNAKDQGGFEVSVVSQIDAQSPNSTSVYIEYTPEVKTYHENLNKYFVEFEPRTIKDNHLQSFKVYRKGVLVCENKEQKALFAYNIDDLKVDESRNAEMYQVMYNSAMALRWMDENQTKKFVNALVNGTECIETRKFEAPYIAMSTTNAKIKTAWKELFGDTKIVSPILANYVSKKFNTITVSEHALQILGNAGVELAEINGGRIGIENGYMPICVTTDCKKIFNRVWNKIEKLGLHNGKTKPELQMFCKPMEAGSTVGGYYENGIVYIDRNHVNAKVIVEEIGHHVTGANDCTRDFQDWAFNVAGALL